MVAAAEAIQFTVEVRELTSEVRTFEVTDEVVAATPLTVVVMTLPEVVAELVVADTSVDVATHVGTPPTTERTVPFAPGAYGVATLPALPTKMLPRARGILGSTENVVVAKVEVPLTVRLLFKKRLDPVALPKMRLVKFARVEKRLVVVAFVAVKFVMNAFVVVELVVVEFTEVRFVTLRVSMVTDPIFDAVRNGVAVAAAEVIRPCASTVRTGMVVDEP